MKIKANIAINCKNWLNEYENINICWKNSYLKVLFYFLKLKIKLILSIQKHLKYLY